MTQIRITPDTVSSLLRDRLPLECNAMERFRDALQVLNSMKDEGVIEDYAVAGAMAIGKAALREHRRALPLPEKVRQMLELQRIRRTIVSRRRPMRSWEHPWDVEP